MSTRSPFSPYGGPAGLIDRMIGEEYEVVKSVADALPDLPPILDAVNAVGGLISLVQTTLTYKNAAEAAAASVTQTATLVIQARDLAEGYRDQANQSAQLAASSAGQAATAAATAGQQAGIANTAANQADARKTEAAASAVLAQKWATQTNAEVAAGQGYGARKYAVDAQDSAVDADGAAVLAELARAAAVAAKNEAVAIAGFDPATYATKAFARQQAKRAVRLFRR